MQFILTTDQVDKLKRAISIEKGIDVDVEDVTENDVAEYLDELIDNL